MEKLPQKWKEAESGKNYIVFLDNHIIHINLNLRKSYLVLWLTSLYLNKFIFRRINIDHTVNSHLRTYIFCVKVFIFPKHKFNSTLIQVWIISINGLEFRHDWFTLFIFLRLIITS